MSKPRNANRLAVVMIVITGAACVAALFLRTPLRSYYWASRVIESPDVAEQAVYLTALCNAGEAGRWGTSRLLGHESEAARAAGVIVLQNVRSAWSASRLMEMLSDRSRHVRELATLGLAIHGDESVIPRLREMFNTGDEATVGAACVALQRLATPGSIATLTELADADATIVQRAHLIDALGGIATAECVPALVNMLNDHRRCSIPTRASQLALDALSRSDELRALGGGMTSEPSEPPPETVAERAAAALERITGIDSAFTSELNEAERNESARRWLAWLEHREP